MRRVIALLTNGRPMSCGVERNIYEPMENIE
jgi:hypothetical protein